MATEVRRDSFKTFWDKYSDKPDTNSMMLNQTANDLEASDRYFVVIVEFLFCYERKNVATCSPCNLSFFRAEILSSLPLLTNKDVVDIGAGIG